MRIVCAFTRVASFKKINGPARQHKKMLEKHEMGYEMKRIEQALPGSIKPPRGYGRGRKWEVETMIPRVSHAFPSRIKMEINFTHPDFITVVAGLDLIGGIPGFLSKKYVGKNELIRIHDVFTLPRGRTRSFFAKHHGKCEMGYATSFTSVCLAQLEAKLLSLLLQLYKRFVFLCMCC